MTEIRKAPTKKGLVIKNSRYNEGTIVVKVKRTRKHSKYKKIMSLSKNYIVQWNDKTPLDLGTVVEIKECAPISKRKYFQITRILTKGEI